MSEPSAHLKREKKMSAAHEANFVVIVTDPDESREVVGPFWSEDSAEAWSFEQAGKKGNAQRFHVTDLLNKEEYKNAK